MRWICRLALPLALLLAGCSRIAVSNDYLSVTPHDEDYTLTDTADTPEVSTYDEIVDAIVSLVEEGEETGVFRVAGYDGDVSEAVATAALEVMRFTPYGTYFVDYINPTPTRIVSYYEVRVDITYRDTPAKLDEIVRVRGERAQEAQLQAALEAHVPILTLFVTGGTLPDYQALANAYYEAHEEIVVARPTLDVDVYPDSGEQRIVEIRFNYPESLTVVAGKAQMVQNVLDSAVSYVQYRQTELERMSLLWSFLMERFQYQAGESQTPVYSLLWEGTASSAAFARTLQAICARLEMECYTVTGYRDGETYMWNIVCLDGVYYHIDLMQSALSENPEFRLLTDEDMTQYQWDTDAYPACPAPETEQPPESAEPADAPAPPEEESEGGPEEPVEPAPEQTIGGQDDA